MKRVLLYIIKLIGISYYLHRMFRVWFSFEDLSSGIFICTFTQASEKSESLGR